MKLLRPLFTITALALTTSMALAAPPPAPEDLVPRETTGITDVSLKGDLLSVNLQNASVKDVLNRLADTGWIQVKVIHENPSDRLTDSFKDLPLKDGLGRLLRKYSYVLSQPPDGQAKLVVWGSTGAESAAGPPRIDRVVTQKPPPSTGGGQVLGIGDSPESKPDHQGGQAPAGAPPAKPEPQSPPGEPSDESPSRLVPRRNQ